MVKLDEPNISRLVVSVCGDICRIKAISLKEAGIVDLRKADLSHLKLECIGQSPANLSGQIYWKFKDQMVFRLLEFDV